jgi:hypothetical protein
MRRRLRSVCFLAAIGTVANLVLVAAATLWELAFDPRELAGPGTFALITYATLQDGRELQYTVIHSLGSSRYVDFESPPLWGFGSDQRRLSPSLAPGVSYDRRSPPVWLPVDQALAHPSEFVSRGWPCRAFWCESTSLAAMPYRPILTSIIVNTATLGTGLWLLIAFRHVWRWPRRALRRRRGECVRCGYDRRGGNGTACPECGV